MPKRKPPPEKRVWARMIGSEWQINLVGGEVLKPANVIEFDEARRLSRLLSVFRVSYLAPVLDLTGDAVAIERELQEMDAAGYEHNTARLFRGNTGTEAVVFEHHH